jgi:cobalt-zinc-cadmium efflux system membrane fusion protein
MDSVREIPDMNILTMNGKVCYDQNHVAQVYPLTGGLVSKILVSVGDRVHKGQVLAQISGGDVNSVAGEYEVAKANSDLAKKAMEVAEQLYHTNVYSERDYLNAKNEYTKALAEEAKAKGYAGMMGLDDKTQVYNVTSPVDGFIVEKNISENMMIRPDNTTNIFTVSSLDQVWVMADLYETDLSKVKIGDNVKITTIAYPDKIFNGTISQIGNALDPISRVAKVKIVLSNNEGLLKPEMYANVKCYNVNTASKVLAIPTKSLILEGNHYVVMVKRGTNEFSKEIININRTIDNITIVNSGVKSGETVVTDGSLLVSNNNAAMVNQ